MTATKSYSISYKKINELFHLIKSIPPQVLNRSKYFQNIKDLFWRTSSLEEKYKVLVDKLIKSRIQADELAEIKKRRGIGAFEEEVKRGNTDFSAISHGSDGTTINFGSKKIVTALQDYVNRYSELLETLKYLIADIYNDPPGKRDSFNGYIVKKHTKANEDFDFSYLTDFNKHLWNFQKHQSDISLTPLVYKQSGVIMPRLHAEGRFRQVDLETFTDGSLDNLIELLKFIRSRFQSNSQNKS